MFSKLKMKAVKREDKKILDPKREYICVACKESFKYKYLLKYHIRKYHFNCVGLAPYAATQNVNNVWVEKVKNTDTLVEIKKVGINEIFIQKVKDDTIQPTKMICEVINVTKDYPVCTGGEGIVECRVCQQRLQRKGLGKHFALKHAFLLKKHCDVCGTAFKHLYNCASHICSKSTIK